MSPFKFAVYLFLVAVGKVERRLLDSLDAWAARRALRKAIRSKAWRGR
jgi:hypothetical protein